MQYIPILFLAYATYTDAKDKKIKNNLTYPLILIGLIINTYGFGFHGLLVSIGGVIVSLLAVTLLPGFRHGGGDTKLAMGIGSFLGITQIGYFLFVWFVLSLLICNFKLVKKQGLRNFKNILVREILTLGRSEEEIESTIGAPIMLIAYLLILIFL